MSRDSVLASDGTPDVTVAICTFRRNHGLEMAAASVVAQERGGISLELVIVDNNPGRDAEPVVARLAGRADFPVRYVHASPPNISVARNAAIQAARGRYVAFMDDDEEAVPGWIAALLETARKTGADMVFGPTEPVFEAGPPEWNPDGSRYRKWLDVPDGGIADILGEFGNRRSLGLVATGNVLIGPACRDEAEPFDLQFGRRGGEDTDFFRRQIARGRRAAWSERALVREHIPADRTTLEFMIRRTFRESQTFVRVMAKNSSSPGRVSAVLRARGAVQAAVWLLPSRLHRLLPPSLAVRARFAYARGTGKLLCHRDPRTGDPVYN